MSLKYRVGDTVRVRMDEKSNPNKKDLAGRTGTISDINDNYSGYRYIIEGFVSSSGSNWLWCENELVAPYVEFSLPDELFEVLP